MSYDAENDFDEDGICGDIDNCPLIVNENQENFDNDIYGNACDECPYDPYNDSDADGICGDVMIVPMMLIMI